MEVGNNSAREIQCQVADIFNIAFRCTSTGRLYTDRFLFKKIRHDRNVVGCQIPDDIDIMLEQTQVDPYRIVVTNGAELTGLNDISHFTYRTGIDESMIDMQ